MCLAPILWPEGPGPLGLKTDAKHILALDILKPFVTRTKFSFQYA